MPLSKAIESIRVVGSGIATTDNVRLPKFEVWVLVPEYGKPFGASWLMSMFKLKVPANVKASPFSISREPFKFSLKSSLKLDPPFTRDKNFPV